VGDGTEQRKPGYGFGPPGRPLRLTYDNGWLVGSGPGVGWRVGSVDPLHPDGEGWYDYRGPLGWAKACAEAGKAEPYEGEVVEHWKVELPRRGDG
jgi:hypothetical protein